MDPIVAAFLSASTALLVTSWVLSRHQREAEARRRMLLWRDAATAAGLTAVERSEGAIEGWSGELRVRLERLERAEVSGTRITISGPGIHPDLVLKRGTAGQNDVQIGDERFDDSVLVRGPTAVLRAVLDADTRRIAHGLVYRRLERPGRLPIWAEGRVEKGALRADVADLSSWRGPNTRGDVDGGFVSSESEGYDYLGGSERLPEALSLTLAFARRLEPPKDLACSLADRLAGEPEARARLLLLDTLLEEFPEAEAARSALLASRSDPDARVRLRAGIRLGPEGQKVLLDLAGGEGAEDEINAQALAALGGSVAVPDVLRVLHEALRLRKLETSATCLELLAKADGPEAIAALGRVLAVERGGLAGAAAQALGATDDPAAEVPLLAALAGTHEESRVAAVRALGRVGTAAAVPALKDAEAGDGRLRHAARQAIAEIHSRLSGASPGQLSLAEGESGELSLAEDDATGRLSLAGSKRPTGRR